MTNRTVSNDDFDNIIVRGYHGTTLRAANSILDNGFDFSTNKYDWLGKGLSTGQKLKREAEKGFDEKVTTLYSSNPYG
jgi:hypothetical protein